MMLTSDTEEEPSPHNSNEKGQQNKIQALTFVSTSQASFHDRSATTSLNDSQLKSPAKDAFFFGSHMKRGDSDLLKSPFASSEQMTRSNSKYQQDEYLTGSEGDFDQHSLPFKKITLEKIQTDSVIAAKEGNTSEGADSEESRDDEELNDLEGKSLEAEIEEEEDNGERTNYFLECSKAKMEDISSLTRLSACQTELDKHAKSLNDLQSNPTKEYFMLGEKNPPNYADLDLADGVDEINEDMQLDQNTIDYTNHRKIVSINPIYLCEKLRLQFKDDALNDDNTQSGSAEEGSDDGLVKTAQNFKKNHLKLKEQKYMMNAKCYKSCFNL